MLLAAVSLSINLVAVVIGNPDEASMAVAIAAVLYANQRRIQLLFRGEQVAAFTEPPRRRGSRMSAHPADLALLRRYEPVLHFTRGEMFLPTRIDGYLQRCSLWRARGRRAHQQLAAVGEITAENIADKVPGSTGATDYLRFVQEPMDFAGYRAWRHSTDRPSFSAIGRWARVGVLSRLLDAGFDISLSLRGVVPGGTVAVAEQQFAAMQAERPGCSYYGRVVREGGYIACHYLFFYVMNDFRSTFFGVNDHEADWEQVIVYLTDPGPGLDRRAGADLGRLRRARPVRCRPAPPVRRPAAAAGRRHAPGRARRSRVARRATSTRASTCSRCDRNRCSGSCGPSRPRGRSGGSRCRQGIADPTAAEWSEAFAVPFIDYARGDGPRVGPGTEIGWDPVLLDRGRTVAGPLPRAVGPGHRRPVRRRAGPGRPQVQPGRLDPDVVVGRARLRRAGQGGAGAAARQRTWPPGSTTCVST